MGCCHKRCEVPQMQVEVVVSATKTVLQELVQEVGVEVPQVQEVVPKKEIEDDVWYVLEHENQRVKTTNKSSAGEGREDRR